MSDFRAVLCTVESDSHMWNLVYLQLLLEENGGDVVNLGACTPVRDVVEKVRSGRPDLLVLSSVNGHGAHGARVLRAALQAASGAAVPSVAGGKLTTAESDNDRVRRELLAAGWTDVFTGDDAVPRFVRFLDAGKARGFDRWHAPEAVVAPWDDVPLVGTEVR
ncbi:cobalamin B12-binding domain-containing protein [Cellulomonas telluris]|uniref:cobalamin B12-binding domain-containing protein n=1 Tax=Cellulomonas telluris TaxID=2306636 RepID=UPI001CA3AA4C|nr:cobalamin-dependent protein [Cellulomonas telluris]